MLILATGLIFSFSSASAEEGNTSWKDTLKSAGKVYSSDSNPVIQEVKLFGRAHAQWNYSDGDSAGEDFSGSGEELRRLRAGASIKFLNGFKALGRLNLEEGGFGDTQLGYESFDELYLEYGKKALFGFDRASIGYGRYKLLFGGEEHQSSKKIKTVERSGLNNHFGSARPTGLVLNAEKNNIKYIAGVYSTEADDKAWANWNGGMAFQGSVEFDAFKGSVIADFVYADDSDNDRSVFDYDWASSVTYNRAFGDLNVMTNLTYAETGKENIYGFVIVPSMFLIENKLEAAFRYQWGHSTVDGQVPKSSSSRGIRRVASNDGVGTGSGDNNHTLYAGLNYYIAGDHAKIMTGIEYEKIDGNLGRDLDGVTFWTAFRIYF